MGGWAAVEMTKKAKLSPNRVWAGTLAELGRSKKETKNRRKKYREKEPQEWLKLESTFNNNQQNQISLKESEILLHI